ncbi:MAG TPA: phosphatase PAP2 family protein [Chthoniobacteraceae bacterium]|nr:phosphatase PAP2 family protein [Chthoniobacteraceae bacterium]
MNNADSIAGRLRALWPLKLALTIALYPLLYAPYLFLQQHHYFPATTLQAGKWELLIPFQPQAVWIYFSNFLLMGVGPYLMNQRGQILRYVGGLLLITFVANVIFLFWPTVNVRPDPAGANTVYRLLIVTDKPYHSFPSLHAAFAVYSALSGGLAVRDFAASRAWRAVLWIWALLVLYSTIATRQHVLVDIAAGSVLAFAGYACAFHTWKKSAVLPKIFPAMSDPT